MKIVYVTRELPPSKRCGGIGSYVWDTARGLTGQGHQVTVIAASDDIFQDSDQVIDGVRVIRLSGVDFYLPKNNNRYIRTLGSIIRGKLCFKSYRKKIVNTLQMLINSGDADIVEFAEYGDEAHVWLRSLNRLIPTVVRFHGPEGHDRNSNTIDTSRKSVKLHFETAFMADGLTSPSEEMFNTLKQNDFASVLLNSYQSPVEVISNSIDIQDWETENTSRSSSCKIFAAGSVCFQKGFNELVDSVKELRDKGYDIKLEIAGKLGALGVDLKGRSELMPEYKDWLSIPGQITRAELKHKYAEADIVCLPSWWESFGYTCIEAMACRGLVLGSSRGGMAEIVADGEDGFLVAPKASHLLAEKIEYILNLPDETKNQIRRNAHEKVIKQFDNKVVLKRLTDFYGKLIDHYKAEIKQ